MATMAEQSTDPFYVTKRRTWLAFKRLVVWCCALIALTLLLMRIFLV
jgi:hypothetical protein